MFKSKTLVTQNDSQCDHIHITLFIYASIFAYILNRGQCFDMCVFLNSTFFYKFIAKYLWSLSLQIKENQTSITKY